MESDGRGNAGAKKTGKAAEDFWYAASIYMELNFPTPEKDANGEKPTIRNVNAALARLGLARGMDITVKALTHDNKNWIAETYESAKGSNSLTDGATVRFERGAEQENASAVAQKLWAAYGIEVREPPEI